MFARGKKNKTKLFTFFPRLCVFAADILALIELGLSCADEDSGGVQDEFELLPSKKDAVLRFISRRLLLVQDVSLSSFVRKESLSLICF